MRTCTACSEEKPLADFGRDKSQADGRSKRCRECVRVAAMRRYNANKEAINSRRKVYYRANADAVKNVPTTEPDPSELLSDELDIHDPTKFEFSEEDFE